MILEIIGAGALGIGIASAIALMGGFTETKKLPEEKLKKFDDKHFLGLRGGVFISNEDETRSAIQSLLEQKLVELGMELYTLHFDAVEKLVKDGVFGVDISSRPLDIIIAGKCTTIKETREEWEYPTVRHVDTETGLRFDALPYEHPHYRTLNSYSFDSERKDYYSETKEEFTRRRELEKKKITVEVEKYRVDIRFYGPNGTIRGACICSADSQQGTSEALQTLLCEIIEKLVHAVPISRVAHDVAEIIPELQKQ